MEVIEFRTRARAQFEKLGVKTYREFIKAIGYNEKNCGSHFYTHGVPKRAIIFLEMLEKRVK